MFKLASTIYAACEVQAKKLRPTRVSKTGLHYIYNRVQGCDKMYEVN